MRKVTKEEFFSTMNPLNVHPRVDVTTLRDAKIVSHWEMQDGTRRCMGTSKGHWDAAEYYLA